MHFALTPALQQSLEVLPLALKHVPERSIHIFPEETKPVLVYTDASAEAPCPSGCRVGVWILHDDTVYCDAIDAVDVPAEVLRIWMPRKTQINLLRLIAVPLVARGCPELVANRDVLWFIDNQAALSSLVRAASRVQDVNYLSLITSLLMAILKTRPWYEWVPPASNISDPLSRQGLFHPLVQAKLLPGQWRRHLGLRPEWQLLRPDSRAVAHLITALGEI